MRMMENGLEKGLDAEERIVGMVKVRKNRKELRK